MAIECESSSSDSPSGSVSNMKGRLVLLVVVVVVVVVVGLLLADEANNDELASFGLFLKCFLERGLLAPLEGGGFLLPRLVVSLVEKLLAFFLCPPLAAGHLWPAPILAL